MKFKEIKEKTTDELMKLLAEAKGKRVLFRFHASAGQESNVRKGRLWCRTIARILTVMQQRKREDNSGTKQ